MSPRGNREPEFRFLRSVFESAVAAASPALCLPPILPKPPPGRTIIIGFGKAAAAMALAVEQNWPAPLEGVAVTRYGHGNLGNRIRVIEAAHPIPDAQGMLAATEILAAVQGLSPDDLVLCLVSGGGSAMLVKPPPGLTLGDKQQVNAALLRSGAAISEINCVRKHLSAIKGGRLAKACAPARIINLVISDVPGDDPATIACGPTVPDPTTAAQAQDILARYRIVPPPCVLQYLRTPEAETPKPSDPDFARVETIVAASGRIALQAAARAATEAGIVPIILGDDIEGEARSVAAHHANLAREILARGQRAVILSGGETSVTVTGKGRGGRNAEFLLALGLALDGAPGIHALACDTDGIDGTEDNAGALLSPDSLARARKLGIDPAAYLANNDAYGFFAALGDLVVTGPTRTNVNDFRAILIDGTRARGGRA